MYLDYILFAISGGLFVITILLFIWLLRSRKQSSKYQQVLREETQKIDVVGTLRSTESLTSAKEDIGRTVVTTNQAVFTVLDEPAAGASDDGKTDCSFIDNKTEMPLEPEDAGSVKTDLRSHNPAIGLELDLTPLMSKYELLKEIYGGGMSRIFLARHATLENEWVVKYVPGKQADLANEAEVLKKLNHISLPQIIDIFQSDQGTFLVERYIEGYTLNQAMKLGAIKESLICDWALQLAQVLGYLHNLEIPIIHCDMKPSNIMVTYDNRLVLIDFGISKRQGIDEKQTGLTYRYAAPEQFKSPLDQTEGAIRRFGTLPPEHNRWPIDARTDLYSVGVILYELATGEIPGREASKKLRKNVSPGLADIIEKCLEIFPEKRFQTAQELIDALDRLKERKTSMVRSLILRRVAMVCCAASLALGMGTTASAAYINQQENLSVVDMNPGRVVVTAQQSVQLLLQKTMPSGEVVVLEPSQFQWSYSDDNIARLDGDRLVGINVGETTLYGQYRNKVISLTITVTEPVEELVEVALRYPEGTHVELYAGDGQREIIDGPLAVCSFISPEDMAADGDILYLSDSGVIRAIQDGVVSSIYLEPDFLTASLVRGWKEEMYVLTGPWVAEDEVSYYGILRISEEDAEFLYFTEAAWSVIPDFAFSSDGTLWFIQQNMGTGATTLNTLDLETLEAAWVMDLPDSARGMAFDARDTLYMAVPDSGVIIRVSAGERKWTYFAGLEGERNFVDGAIPNFYRPTSLAVQDNALYVLDFDVVRKITIEGEGALFTETLAGIPTEDTHPDVKLGKGDESVLPASELAALALNHEGRLLLSDPKNNVLYEFVTLR